MREYRNALLRVLASLDQSVAKTEDLLRLSTNEAERCRLEQELARLREAVARVQDELRKHPPSE
jgi:hypothetical protein